MEYIARASIKFSFNWREVIVFGATAVVAILCWRLAERSSTAAVALLGAMLAIGWIAMASALTFLCGAQDLVVAPPALQGEFHALSRFHVNFRVADNRERLPALFLTFRFELLAGRHALESPPIFLGNLAPGGSINLGWDITGRMRGEYELCEFIASSAFPGSLFALDTRFSFSRKFLALPAVCRIDTRALEILIGRRQAGGRMQATPLSMEEFIGVRDYRPGDNPRQIHLALSMRTPGYPYNLVLREFEDPSADDVCVLLDTALMSEETEDVRLLYRHERSLCFAVALCRLLADRRYRVRFVSLDQQGGIDFMISKPSRDIRRLEARLARVQPVTDPQLIAKLVLRESVRSNDAVIFISLRDTPKEKARPRLPVFTVTPNLQNKLIREIVVT